MTHFWGAHPGGYNPHIQTQMRFLYTAPIPEFHHPMFTRSEVIVLTNKQTDASENIQCSSLRYDVTGTENILLPDMISKLFES